MKKRIMSLLLALVLLLALLPTAALAATGAGTAETPSVTVYFSLSDDDQYVVGDNDDGGSCRALAYQKVTVPYFDLALYGLEDFYFQSESYGQGGLGGASGEPYGAITVLHLLIYMLERDYIGLDEADCGKGYLYDDNLIGTSVLAISGSAGGMFLQELWDHDLNLTYYVNYEYPLASEGWGSTADQILLHDDDIVSLSLFSDWSFWSDPGMGYHYLSASEDQISGEIKAAPDDVLDLTLFRTTPGDNYSTDRVKIEGLNVYYAPVDSLYGDGSGDVTTWTLCGTTEADGAIQIDLGALDLTPGDYVFSVAGQYGEYNPDAIVSCPGGTLVSIKAKEEEKPTKPVTPVLPSTPAAPTLPNLLPLLTDVINTGACADLLDVSRGDWYYDAVEYMMSLGLMNGTSRTTFSPNADTTRGMIVTMLARLEGQNTSGTPWYAAGQKWAMDAGISDGTNMTAAISREQLASMLYRYAKSKGYDVSKTASLGSYADAAQVSAYASDAMRWAVANGLIQGSGSSLSPKATATRAQVAAILMRFAQLAK